VAAIPAGCGGRAGTASRPRIEVVRLEPARVPVRTEVRPGDTIESVARRLAGRHWVVWRDAIAARIPPRRLRPGLVFRGKADAAGRLLELAADLDLATSLRWRGEGGSVRGERIERPVRRDVVRVEGTVERSLFEAVAAVGEAPELAVRLAEIFQWDIDFFRDLRRGDRFVMVVERETVEGRLYRYGRIYAARFVNAGRTLDAILYRGPDGREGYYDPGGRPLRKQFLKAPLRFTRISSRFSLSRVHPLHRRRMPHYGVDYAAPVGTPVHATADGVVTYVGRRRAEGRMVRIRHPNGYETYYLHLSRFARGIRRGVRVRQGQVIGYVGATGWATGPHLDYRIRHRGRWLNPLRLASPPARPLDSERRERFRRHAAAVEALLDGGEAPAGARC